MKTTDSFKRFVPFVKEHIGPGYLDIADYFNDQISQLARECRIDWEASKNDISYNGEKNKHPIVRGLEKQDKGRVYTWANSKTFDKSGDSFTYPVISFKSKQNSYGQPGEYFNPKRANQSRMVTPARAKISSIKAD